MQLVALNGPLAGTALSLADGLRVEPPAEIRERRGPSCRVRASADGTFVLHALDHHGSVFVNGLPVTSRPLQPGDEVRLGDSVFVARHEERVASSPLSQCPVSLGPLPRVRQVFELGFDEGLLQVHGRTEAHSDRDLALLMRSGAALSSVRGLASVDAALAGFVFDILPAERVVFADPGDPAPLIRSAWTTSREARPPVPVDPELLKRVIHGRLALVVEFEHRCAVVAPMMAFGRATGAVWAEAPSGAEPGASATTSSRVAPSPSIDKGHVRLLLAVTALAAVAREQSRETARLQETRELLQAEINLEHNMVGRSKPMRTLFDRIARVAQTDATVLLRGESGTGKELVARAVHRNSGRANRPFIAINCAALTESLLESELFGHEKGAFTGAIGLKKGRLELADGGTLLLDEIGDMPLPLQAKLLRAIQEREFERVGGTKPVRVDFRLIAATNRDLDAAVKSGGFRRDLFYRLNVVTLALPALRDRKQDLPLLADYFVRKHASRCGRRACSIAPDALAVFLKHDWPGNVRELENIIEQALVLGSGDQLLAADLPPALASADAASPSSFDYHETIERTKRELIVRAFEQAGRSHTDAARLLGVHPNYLHRLIRNLDLRSRVGTPESRSLRD
jgi:transcriptional regulator with GAF, ATPase, and Fis domain